MVDMANNHTVHVQCSTETCFSLWLEHEKLARTTDMYPLMSQVHSNTDNRIENV